MRRQLPNGNPGRDQQEEEQPWDAHDPARQKDQMAPPTEPCECHCFHCGRAFMSTEIWFQKVINARDGFDGFWMCPTPNCGGAGFTFDIFPTDPNHPANEGWFSTDDADNNEDVPWEDEDKEEEEFWEYLESATEEAEVEYDPDEPHYQMMDQWSGEDEDLEGEEWKYGLSPGERPEPAKPDWVIEEEKKYDEPDRRPRELDWSDMERPERGAMGEDDIPF